MEPRIQYAKTSDGVNIAFATSGGGTPLLMVLDINALISLEAQWQITRIRRLIERVADSRMVVRMDPRGRGLSDRDVADRSLEAYVSDVRCVVDAVGTPEVDLVGQSPVAIAYAATHPARVRRLLLCSVLVRGRDLRVSPLRRTLAQLAGIDFEFYKKAIALHNAGWTEGQALAEGLRSLQLEEFEAAARAARALDVTDMLPGIQCPTLVLHMRGMEDMVPFDASRGLAAAIPHAELRIVETRLPTIYDEVGIAAILEFVGRDESPVGIPNLPSGTAIILFLDIAGSTELTTRLGDAAYREKERELDGALRQAIREAGGSPVEGKVLGDGVMATFGSAREAIEAATRCSEQGRHAGLPLHAGIHAGDVLREENNVHGGAVQVAARIADASAPGEVLVSDIVRGLARTSAGVSFEDRGERELKGVSEPVRVFAVRSDG